MQAFLRRDISYLSKKFQEISTTFLMGAALPPHLYPGHLFTIALARMQYSLIDFKNFLFKNGAF
jgi:hypothetical protein